MEANAMHRPLICCALLILLFGSRAVAQDAARQAPAQSDGKSLAEPYQQQQADEAMNTESGKAGKTEPGAHAPTSDQPVLKDGKLNVPSAPTGGQSNSARQ